MITSLRVRNSRSEAPNNRQELNASPVLLTSPPPSARAPGVVLATPEEIKRALLPSFRGADRREKLLLIANAVLVATLAVSAAYTVYHMAASINHARRDTETEGVPEHNQSVNGVILGAVICVAVFIGLAYSIKKLFTAPDSYPELNDLFAQWDITPNEARNLSAFAMRVRRLPAYEKTNTREHLLDRTAQLLHRIQVAPPGVRSTYLNQVEDALTNCSDRMALIFNQIEIDIKVANLGHSETSENELRELGKQVMRYEILLRHAYQAVRESYGQESVETILQFLAHPLAREVGFLPITPDNQALLTAFGHAEDFDVVCAINAAQTSSHIETEVAAFLQTWSPWIKHLRHREAAALSYDRLPKLALGENQLALMNCSITLAPYSELDQPIIVVNGTERYLYDFEAFKTWWQDNGTLPETRAAAEVANWHRATVKKSAFEKFLSIWK